MWHNPIMLMNLLNKIDFLREDRILSAIQDNFGLEVFTPGLERTKELYKPFKEFFKKNNTKILTVAGTNGKGQVCLTLESLLNHSNYSTALWTSPHILSIKERFRYNGDEISYDDLEELIESTSSEVLLYPFKISFYEFLFLVFLKWIGFKKCDFLLLEVGLGGRFDAVNHFDNDLSIITSISRDHQAILGNRFDLILHEKLGITRRERPLLTAFNLSYLVDEVTLFCEKNKIPYKNIKSNDHYFFSNQKLAIEALKSLGVKFNEKMTIPVFKARDEIIKNGGNDFLFIGAHNPDGMRKTMSYVRDQKSNFDIILASFSKREASDINSMINTILESKGSNLTFILTHFDHPKALPMSIFEDVLKNIKDNNQISFSENWKKFLDGIKDSKPEKKILVVGSYYFIGEVQRFLFTHS
jgi:dihydrofolate synthase/folylpolyglutamate synthase